jgi:hypothetical protein
MSDEKSFFDKAKEFAGNLGEDISEHIEKAGDFIEDKLGGDSHAEGAAGDAAEAASDAASSDAVNAAKDAVSDATDGS